MERSLTHLAQTWRQQDPGRRLLLRPRGACARNPVFRASQSTRVQMRNQSVGEPVVRFWRILLTCWRRAPQGISFGVADGVGGWAASGVDPSLFSQTLMYHSHRYAKVGWPGEPEIDSTQDYEDREAIEGWELHPQECLKLAYQATLRERSVIAGPPVSPEIT